MPGRNGRNKNAMTAPYRLIGSNPSPYSVKMRALMRYRRLPFVWEWRNPANMAETAHLKPQVIPILQLPDGTFRNDSTFLALELEDRHPGQRSVLPADAAQRFLCLLLEDLADEWGTKIMFHYRWAAAADQDFCSNWIAGEIAMGQPYAQVRKMAAAFRDRQVGRMALVGCTPENAPIIEDCCRLVFRAFDEGLREQPFLFGQRPTLADFGWFGQLFQLFMDPTPSALMRLTAPRVAMWIPRMDDCSGLADDAPLLAPDAPTPVAVEGLLRLAGEVYLPFLRANAAALAEGRDEVRLELMGRPYAQAPFKYQAKCLDWLRQEYARLPADARARLAPPLERSGCLAHLA